MKKIRFPRALFQVSLLASGVLLASVAQAQTDATPPASLFGDHTDITAGVATLDTPRYAGADREHVQIAPVLVVARGMLFFDTARGAGLQFQSDSGFYISQSLYYDLGRVPHDSDWRPGSRTLAGMGTVPGSTTARTLAIQQITPYLSAHAEAEFALRESARRNRYRAGLEFTVLHSPTNTVTLDIDALAGDGRFNQAYFGVSPTQAARTGRPVFHADSGVYAAAVGISWLHALSKHWSSTLSVTATRYTDNVDSSPLVMQRQFVTTSVGLIYSR